MFRKSYGQSGGSGSGRFARGGFNRPRRGGNPSVRSRKTGFGQSIDVARFTKSAQPITPTEAYSPTYQFADFPIHEQLKKNISAKGFITPTPIQDQTIMPVLEKTDVVGIANTGTGKTAAFLIPLLNKVMTGSQEKVLIVVPTRELALQINEEFLNFRGSLHLYSACCFGGSSIGQQISSLRRGAHFVIGTPGRLKDLIERRALRLDTFGTIVLDEADRMLDMGFVKDMRFIMAGMAPNRQTLLFSATLNSEIGGLVKEFLREPVTISVKKGETACNVDQDVVRLKKGEDKIEVLHQMLKKPEFNKVLIFGRTKFGVERLSETLMARGFKAEAIHGNKNQSKRQRALNQFKDNRSQILVATDVAARGLDIPDVSHVINYDLPATYDDYVHRIGRTGRGDKTGKALTFIS